MRRRDPDRFLLALLMPAELREAAFALAAFDHELVRAVGIGGRGDGRAESVLSARIRLQWWRDVLDGARPREPVAIALGAVLDRGAIPSALLGGLLDAREAELDGVADEAAWRAALDGGPGNLARAFGHLIGLPPDIVDICGIAGAAYGAGRQLRRARASVAEGHDEPFPGAAAAAILAASSLAPLRAAPRPPVARAQRAPLLHGVLARRDLARVIDGAVALDRRERGRGVGDRLAVVASWLLGTA